LLENAVILCNPRKNRKNICRVLCRLHSHGLKLNFTEFIFARMIPKIHSLVILILVQGKVQNRNLLECEPSIKRKITYSLFFTSKNIFFCLIKCLFMRLFGHPNKTYEGAYLAEKNLNDASQEKINKVLSV